MKSIEAVKDSEGKVQSIIVGLSRSKWDPEWVAKVTGFSEKYVYDLSFLGIYDRDWSWSGKTGTTYFNLYQAGYYICYESSKGKYFIHWDGESDKIVYVDEEDVVESLKKQYIKVEVTLTQEQEEILKSMLNKDEAAFVIYEAKKTYTVIRCLDKYYLELLLSSDEKSVMEDSLHIKIPSNPEKTSEDTEDTVHFEISQKTYKFLKAIHFHYEKNKEALRRQAIQELLEKDHPAGTILAVKDLLSGRL